MFCPVLNQKQIPKDVTDVSNAASDKEDFLGFQDDVSRERLLPEDSCANSDTLESEKKVGVDCHGAIAHFGCGSTLSLCQG